MQSIGHGGMHRSQPVHCDAMTVCILVGAPTMQSTGQAWMHSVQPMHSVSSISATASGLSIPLAGFSGSGGRCSSSASFAMPAAPPGGHWLIAASPAAIASAYGRQPL